MWFPDDAEHLSALARLIAEWLSRYGAPPQITRWRERPRFFTLGATGRAANTSEGTASAGQSIDASKS